MAYKMRSDGTFRLRASFPMNRRLMLKANAVCEARSMSMYALCYEAVEQYCDRMLSADGSGLAEAGASPVAYQEAYEAAA